MEMTPRRFSSSLSRASLVSTPRGLNEPVRWKSSAFRKTRPPVSRESVADVKTGVRWRRPAIVSRAARTSSSESRDATATPRSYSRGSGGLVAPPGARGQQLFDLGLALARHLAVELAHRLQLVRLQLVAMRRQRPFEVSDRAPPELGVRHRPVDEVGQDLVTHLPSSSLLPLGRVAGQQRLDLDLALAGYLALELAHRLQLVG